MGPSPPLPAPPLSAPPLSAMARRDPPLLAPPAMALLLATCVLLLAAGLWPRAGAPLWLAVPAEAVGPVFAVPGWRVTATAPLGPFLLLHAVPDDVAASPLGLWRAAGGWLVLAARPRAGCN